ncbi:sigma-70 family RNA polymerase sigma factor [Flavobacteriaceae bacterium R38]|nr:sigma-70 family RNA polymerase sigma factor [Flavobacteriaceae bacterium R38]
MDVTSEIWEAYSEDLRNFIFNKVKDEDVANDILQDVFLKIHTKHDQLKDASRIKPWIFTIARNTVFDFFKTNGLKGEIQEELIEEASFEAEEHTEKDCLYGIIKSLPEKYREPLFLSDIRGIKQTEIAKQFQLPLPTIKSRIQRARKMITEGYMACCDYKLNDKGKLVGELKDKKDCKICNQ